jgi:error-prone DNA polymerase
MMNYTELQLTSNFSFLRGASHPEEIIDAAEDLGYKSLAVADRNTLAGIVRAYAATKTRNVRLIVGCRLDLQDGPSLLFYPTNIASYSNLTNLLTLGNLRTEKGKCLLYKADVYNYSKGAKLILIPPDALNASFEFDAAFKTSLAEYKDVFGEGLSLAASRRYLGDDGKQLHQLSGLSEYFNVPLVATNDVHYHHPARRQLQDILTCIRQKCTIYNAGYKLHPNAERHLKSQEEMRRLFRQYPDAIKQTQIISEACTFSLNELKYEYPQEVIDEGKTPMETLTHLAWQGAERMFGACVPAKIIANIKHELGFIEAMNHLNYASYFITVYDFVRWARNQNILCQGRGSAANSTVCYVLGITSVDPTKHDLLFERFISSARNEPPDIDVDFEHERREEVMQYIFRKYGRHRAAVIATVTMQGQKGALRDVGKAMGLSEDTIKKLSDGVWEFTDDWFDGKELVNLGLNPADKHLRKVLNLTRQYMGFPRQLGQHTGGFVITKDRLSDLCPILNARMAERTNVEWNKDDIDALGFMKVDVLALGMLTCIRKSFELLKKHYGIEHTLASIPQDDPVVYDMICKADTIGVFQIESRAQQSMLPRLKPRCFYDLVIEVAIVRPGPIQGDMVHPYLRRRNGEEAVDYPSQALKEILERTLGVPLFQEQAMKIAIVAAGFTPAEADELRRSMATFKVHDMVAKFEKKLVEGMTSRGYTEDYAKRVFRQLEGFGSYGFPESHAASFASLVYVSSWIKCYYPDVFACALLNSQPMGFYHPAQIIKDAQDHGVTVKPIDVNHSFWDNTLEEKEGRYCVLRLGFRQVNELRQSDVDTLVAGRRQHYENVIQLCDASVSQAALELLAGADAFKSMGLDRREALWQVSAKDKPLALFQGQPAPDSRGEQVSLPKLTTAEHLVHDYEATSLSLRPHAVSFLREKLTQLSILSNKEVTEQMNGDTVKVAGIVTVRQRPGTAKGVVFMTIQDETGYGNLVVFKNVFEAFQKVILKANLIMVIGKLQIEGQVIHVIVESCYDFSPMLRELTPSKKETPNVLALDFPDETSVPAGVNPRAPEEGTKKKIFDKSRNFR